MAEQHTHSSTWQSKINALGPGIMMASAAVGGSHLIASTQAGALYGWQLALIIILTNLFKYPFFRFSAHYTLDTGKSLIEGYAEKSRVYLWVFLILCIASATINAGAVAIVTAAIVKMAIPSLTFDAGIVSVMIMASCLLILASGRYKALDNVSKIIIVSLTIATVAAAAVAMSRGMQMKPDFIEPTPWTLTGLGFLIALMGWMPAPIEISAINSLWVTEKQRINPSSYRDGIFDFNVGYITSAILAVVFLALGAYVQYGNGEEVQMAGGKYVGQLINMYAVTIGDWSPGGIYRLRLHVRHHHYRSGRLRPRDCRTGTPAARQRQNRQCRIVCLEHLGCRLRLGRDFLVQQRNGRVAQIRHDHRLRCRPSVRLVELPPRQRRQTPQTDHGHELPRHYRFDLFDRLYRFVPAEPNRHLGCA